MNKLVPAATACRCILLLPLMAYAEPLLAEQRQSSAAEMEKIVVTTTGQAQSGKLLAESIAVLDEKTIERTSPGHPSQLLNKVAGVHVNDLGGEGHMTAIRQPISTAGVYLFLEDGLPTRPTGFFNHNGLYEIDIPQAGQVEVTKGPGTALYGSDAIGGIFNILTPAPPATTEGKAGLELGQDGWQRGLFTLGGAINPAHRLRADLNLTDSKGFRDNSAYNRQSLNLRYDADWSEKTTTKILSSYGRIDQSGVSGLKPDDYLHQPRLNYYAPGIAERKVDALRLSAEIRHQLDDKQQWMLMPFYRNNDSALMPSWMLSYDPVESETSFYSLGMLAQYRNQATENLLLIAGADYDHSPARYREFQLTVQQQNGFYSNAKRTGRLHYDYDAVQDSLSPYLHIEWQALPSLRLQTGLRYDDFQVDYSDQLPASVPQQIGRTLWLRPASQSLSYQKFSPKFGAVWLFSDNQQLYLNQRSAFRVPSVGQVFRPGSSRDSTALKPVAAQSTELGWRGQFANQLAIDLAYYQLRIQDDVVSFIDGNDRKVTNAGKTSHDGIEAAVRVRLTPELQLNSGWTWTQQQYDDFGYVFSCFPPACARPITENRNYSGYNVGKAPKQIGQISLQYNPAWLADAELEVQWQKVGRYFTDETNTASYPGHHLIDLRLNYQLSHQWRLYGRLMNLQDRSYSSYTSNQVGNPLLEYRPGMPRTFILGSQYQF